MHRNFERTIYHLTVYHNDYNWLSTNFNNLIIFLTFNFTKNEIFSRDQALPKDVQSKHYVGCSSPNNFESHEGFRSRLAAGRLRVEPGVQSGDYSAKLPSRRLLGLQRQMLGSRADRENRSQVHAEYDGTNFGCLLERC